MVKVVFPHFEDKNLDRWMAAPRPVQSVVGIRSGDAKELDLSEALKRFHIASIKSLANRLVISKNFAFIFTVVYGLLLIQMFHRLFKLYKHYVLPEANWYEFSAQ